MATPVFRYKTDSSESYLYFIYDTYFDLPKTISMDLATFLAYHVFIGRSLEGLIQCWANFTQSGASMEGTSFEIFFNAEEKKRLHQISDAVGADDIANHNRVLAREAEFILNNELLNYEAKLIKVYEIGSNLLPELKPAEYYLSLSDTQDWLYERSHGLGSHLAEVENLIALYKEGLPLELIPHVFRQLDFFKNEFYAKGLDNLLPEKDFRSETQIFQKKNQLKLKEFLPKGFPLFAYAFQLLQHNRGFAGNFFDRLKASNLDFPNLEEPKLIQLLSECDVFPAKLICFESCLPYDWESLNSQKEYYKNHLWKFPFFFTDVHFVSEKHEVVAFQLFEMQFYALFDFTGSRLSSFLHDLDLEDNEQIVYRELPPCPRDFSIGRIDKYRKQLIYMRPFMV